MYNRIQHSTPTTIGRYSTIEVAARIFSRAGSSQRSCTAPRQALLSVGSSRRSCTALRGLPSDMCPLPIPWLTVESS